MARKCYRSELCLSVIAQLNLTVMSHHLIVGTLQAKLLCPYRLFGAHNYSKITVDVSCSAGQHLQHSPTFRYGTTPRSSRPAPRVKAEASENAELDQGKRMQNLFVSYGQQPQSARPAPRVKDGWNNAELDQGGRLSRLMHEGDKQPRDVKPQIRAASASGRRITKKNQQGSISQVFSETSKWQIVPSPGVRRSKAY